MLLSPRVALSNAKIDSLPDQGEGEDFVTFNQRD
jgi:hypothetical protein